ncbi:MAG: TonB family protein [Acidobacteriia bacterium]|nr:TonB family protein [Terriglobia bacterium]
MRSVLILIYSALLMISTGAFPQKANQETPPFEPPTVVSATEAVYPIRSVASGTVVLEAALDDGGAITSVRVVRGIPSLTEEAVRALRQWKFQPARLNNHPIASKVPVGFVFVPPSFGPRR